MREVCSVVGARGGRSALRPALASARARPGSRVLARGRAEGPAPSRVLAGGPTTCTLNPGRPA